MNQFDKNQIITFKKSSALSIRKALNKYTLILLEGRAFHQDVLDVEFKIETSTGNRRLQTSDTENIKPLKEALDSGPESAWPKGVEIGEEEEIYISEPIFFALALEYKELLPDIVDCARAIVNVARHYNETDRIWVNEMRLFGVEALYILASLHPRYTYLLAQFFVPNWDSEHATGYELYLWRLVSNKGWTRDNIKAYIWCDNASFRFSMFAGSDTFIMDGDELQMKGLKNLSLGSYLKENPGEYEWFKEAVRERFRSQPILLPSADFTVEEASPVVDLYLTMDWRTFEFFEDEDAQEKQLEQPFLKKTLGDEAYDLQEEILAEVQGPLACHSDEDALYFEQQAYYNNRPNGAGELVVLKEFILALPEGPQIWDFILTGKDAQILGRISRTRIVPLAESRARTFYVIITIMTVPGYYEEGIHEQLDRILNEVCYELIAEPANRDTEELGNGFISHISAGPVSGEESRTFKVNQYLRILDVFYRLLGCEELNEALKETLTDKEHPIISEEEFYKRYSPAGRPPAREIPKLSKSTFGSPRNALDMDQRKKVEGILSTGGREAINCGAWGEPTLSTLTLAAYLVYQDRMNMSFDDKTKELLEYLGNGPWDYAWKGIKDYLDLNQLSEEEISLLENYISNPDYREGKEEEVFTLLRDNLYRHDCIRGDDSFHLYSALQPGYALFFHRDGFQHIILCCYWMRNLMPPLSLHAERLWKLLLRLAPQRVIREIARFSADEYHLAEFDDPGKEEQFYKDLEKAKVPAPQIAAFRMVQAQDRHSISQPCRTEEYLNWLDIYDEIDDENAGMIGAYRRRMAQDLDKGLDYVNERSRIKFFIDLSLRNPRFPFSQSKDFERCLLFFLRLNSKENVDHIRLADEILGCLKGTHSYEETEQSFNKSIDDYHLETVLNRPTLYSLGDFIWLLPEEERNRLIMLLVNHSIRGYKVLEENLFYAYRRHLVSIEKISIEDYLDLSQEGVSDEAEESLENAYRWLYTVLEGLSIRKDFLISFLIDRNSGMYNETLVHLARQGQLTDFIENNSQIAHKAKLIQILQEEDDRRELLAPFALDRSRKIRNAVKGFIK